jgi:8-oxo-dGTP diphosphatase
MIETPFVATDGIIKLYDKDKNFKGLVFISRKNPPLGIALPGGFVDIGEKVEDALLREMEEEVCLEVKIEKLLGVYSDPKRDDRFHTVSLVYVCKAYGEPKAADDAKDVYVYDLENLPLEKLVFDHKKIMEDFLKDLEEL